MVETLKDLERLLKLLRKQGVTDFKMNGIDLKLGELPSEPGESFEQDEDQLPHPAAMTDEQLIAWTLNQAQQ